MGARSTNRGGAASAATTKRREIPKVLGPLSEAASQLRGDLRAVGVRGEIRYLDELCQGLKCTMPERTLRRLVRIAGERQLPITDVQNHLRLFADRLVEDEYRRMGPRAA